MKQFIAVVFLFLIVSGCKKSDSNDQSASGLNFTSIRAFDVEAAPIENRGNPVDDYKMEGWPDWVYNFFTPLDTINLTGYVQSAVSIDALFPNPCADTQNLRLFANQPCNLKLVVIDPLKNVYLSKSFHLNAGSQQIPISYQGLGMAGNTYYRMFYAFSAENKPFFNRGHIDILKTQ
jgi:hypothetical protein